MSYLTMPFVPAFNASGLLSASAKLKFFVTETTTPAAVYSDPDITVSLGAVVTADVFGRFVPIYLDPLVTYRVRLETALGSLIQEADGISGGSGASDIQFIASGTGAVIRTAQSKLRERTSPFDFGAVGDGVADDTAAVQAAITALRSGGTLWLGDGYTFKIDESIVLEKPIRIDGGAMEQSKFLFASGGTYEAIGDGTKAAIIILHSSTVLTGFSGDARRTSFHGFTVSLEGSPANVRGIVICAPAYLQEVRVENFTSTGFAVMAGDRSPIDGIANGTSFMYCAAQSNDGDGFYFLGNDANACIVTRSFSADNGGWGFNDDSFLGNLYQADEADGNTLGGYKTNALTTNVCTFIACYSETPGTSGHFSVNASCVILGNQGIAKPNRATGGVSMRGLPTGPAYLSQQLYIASTDDIANSTGDSPNAGAFMGVGDAGLDYRATNASLHVKLNGLLSANYTDWLNGSDPVARFPNSAFTGNINPKRFHLPDGFTTGGAGKSGIVGADSAAPTTGTYAQGAIVLNDSPAAAGKIGWVCVTGGSPGTWKAWGVIDA
jgi:Pectate lyase superfamily protein